MRICSSDVKQAFERILSALPLKKKQALVHEIEIVNSTINPSKSAAGAHWAAKRSSVKALSVEVRGAGTYELTFDEVEAEFKIPHKTLLQHLSNGKGRHTFTKDDRIFTITKLYSRCTPPKATG